MSYPRQRKRALMVLWVIHSPAGDGVRAIRAPVVPGSSQASTQEVLGCVSLGGHHLADHRFRIQWITSFLGVPTRYQSPHVGTARRRDGPDPARGVPLRPRDLPRGRLLRLDRCQDPW